MRDRIGVRRPLAAALAAMVFVASVCAAEAPDLDPRIERLVASVSADRLAAMLRRLESFGTRSVLSSTDSPGRGVGAARQWLFDELKSYSPRLQVSFDTYRIARQGRVTRDIEIRNVMAVLPGATARRIYISGHYDTIAFAGGQSGRNAGGTGDPVVSPDDSPAPGVNDDGSGTALTLELARLFSQSGLDFDATLVFMLHAGEEQGLYGSYLHARKAADERVAIEAVFNNDIVGNDKGGNGIADGASVRVYSEGPEDSPSRELARFVQRWGARYVPSHRVRLMARPDRFGRGGDHTAYNQLGFAAVGFRESRENFARQHDPRDTFDGVSPQYLAQNARVNAAAAATLALAPAAPVVVDARGPTMGREPSGYDAKLRWQPAARAVAYRIFWRDSWVSDWQHDRLIPRATEIVLPDTLIDDYVFGVASVDADGHESVVAPYVAPARPPITVKLLP